MIVGHKSTTFCRNSQTFSFNFCLQPPPPVLRPAPPASPPTPPASLSFLRLFSLRHLLPPRSPLHSPSSVYSLKLITKMKIADTRLWSGKPSRREGLPLSPPSTPLLSLIRPFSSGKKAPLIRRKGPFHPPAAALLSRRSARATPSPTARARKKGAHPCSLRYCKDITKMPEMQTRGEFPLHLKPLPATVGLPPAAPLGADIPPALTLAHHAYFTPRVNTPCAP